jgi:catechol 2,3-dioxygenase-like lactoylglutathione lyase family enzyme
MKSKIHQPVPELPVRDVEKSQAFYRDKLGFEVGWSYETIGAVSYGETVLFLGKQETVVPNTVWVFADDVDEIYRELTNSAIGITEQIETKPWGIRQFAIEDIDGNKFIFQD